MNNLESLRRRNNIKVNAKRCSLSEIISESYKALYACEEDSKLRPIVESHLNDVRENSSDLDSLSNNLAIIQGLVKLGENAELDAEKKVKVRGNKSVRSLKENSVRPMSSRSRRVKESQGDSQYVWSPKWKDHFYDGRLVKLYYEEGKDPDSQKYLGVVFAPYRDGEDTFEYVSGILKDGADESVAEFSTEAEAKAWVEDWFKGNQGTDLKDSVDPSQDEDFGELTDEELEELTNHLKEIRAKKATVSESRRGIKCTTRRDMKECKSKKVTESVASPSWKDIDLSGFRKNCSSKAFFKTLKKMTPQLHEGNALTRQESINLYKATNSAMTQLSVELEHNPEFLSKFQECTSLLVGDVASVLGALKEGKAPSKKTMKSIAEFADVLLKEDIEEEEEVGVDDDNIEIDFEADFDVDPEAEGGEEIELSPEAEEFYQEYADARKELHDELAEEYEETEDPQVQAGLEQDAAEVAILTGEDEEEEESEESGEEEESEESPEDGESDVESDEDLDITDDELAELKKHLSEMRAARLKESTDRVKQILSNRLSADGKSFIASQPPRGFSFVSCTAGMNPSGEVMFNGVRYAFRVKDGDVRVMTSASAGDNWSETLFKESSGSDEAQVGDTITISRDEDYYTSRGYKVNPEGYVVNKKENYGVFVKEYGYMIPHGDYTVLKKKSE